VRRGRQSSDAIRSQPDGPKIVSAPEALVRLAAGFEELADVMALTLGPTQGPILNARPGGSVELLSDAGTIARRILEVPNRTRNTGAMILRDLAWRMHEQFGDGAATAAVLAGAMVHEGVQRIESGIDPVVIRDGLKYALRVATEALEAQAEPLEGEGALAAFATGVTGDEELGAVLGEVVDLLGPDAAITFEEFPVPHLDREYVEGAYWRAHPAARAMIPEGRAEIVLDNPLIVLVDQALAEADDVVPALEIAVAEEWRPLLIVPAKFGDRALTTVLANQARGSVSVIVSILNTPAAALTADLEDIAVLTGGTVLADVRGRSPRRVQRLNLGTARKAIVRRDSLTIVGGAGDKGLVAERTALIRRQTTSYTPGEVDWQRLRRRVARLTGGIAILKLGARTEAELTLRRARAEKAFRALTGFMVEGAVPGGGVAYLECGRVLRAYRECSPVPGEEHGCDAMLAALNASFTRIVCNDGQVYPPLALAETRRLGSGYGLDVTKNEYVQMRERGIVDSLMVARGALQLATSAAISVLTTGVVVLPEESRRERRMRP
jgi:chaperonin GroEL